MGPINPLVRLHLENLSDIPMNQLCIMTESSNFNTLKLECQKNKIKYCLHSSDKFINMVSDKLKLTLNEIGTTHYFTHNFSIITALKWQLIIESFEHDNTDLNIFTDSDIIWNIEPTKNQFDLDFYFKEYDFLTQKDNNIYCTGIMFIRKTKFNLFLLKDLLNYHMKILESNYLNDQDIFNKYIQQNKSMIGFLPHNKFLIGRELRKNIFQKQKFKSYLAIHANYLVGNKIKFQVLNIISQIVNNQNNHLWIIKLKLSLILFWHQSILIFWYKIKSLYQ
jgi:hypothetical protein